MRSHWFRRFQKRVAFCLVLLGALHPLARAAKPPEMLYYVAVPSCPKNGECIFVACIQLSHLGIPLEAKTKAGQTAPFFSIWRSSYWDEKLPKASVKNYEQWKNALDASAERTVAKKEALSQLPAPILRFFFELEKLRSASLSQQIILQPLFKAEGFVGWQHVKHLDVLATATTASDGERAKALLSSFRDSSAADPEKSLLSNLSAFGTKPRSIRYLREYNVFLIEADAHFKEAVETLFSPTD